LWQLKMSLITAKCPLEHPDEITDT
jgi:hypothetical protein